MGNILQVQGILFIFINSSVLLDFISLLYAETRQ